MPSSDYNEFLALVNSLDQTDELAKFNDNEQLTLLKNIKFYMGRVSDEQINRMFSDKSNRSNLFKFLINSSYNDDASEILFLNESFDVIERLLSAYRHMSDLFNALSDQFLFLFTQTDDAYERIQFMCLQTFYTLASKIDKDTTSGLLSRHLNELLPYLIQHVEKSNAKYSQLLSKFICQLTQINLDDLSGQHVVFDSTAIEEFRKISQREKNSVNFFRIFEIFVNLATISPNLLQECNKNFQLDALITSQIKSDDILSKTNCIDLLTDLALTTHGYHYLTELSVIGQLVSYFDDNEIQNDPFSALILPGIVKLFGNLAYAMPEKIFKDHGKFIKYLLNYLVDDYKIDELAQISLVLDTLTFMCTSNQTKMHLLNEYSDVFFDKIYVQIVWYLKNSVANLQLKALNFLAALLSMNKSNTQLNNIDSSENFKLTKNLFDKFLQVFNINYQLKPQSAYHDKFFDYLIKLARIPFLDKRLAVHNIYRCLCESQWGLSYLFASFENNQLNEHVNVFFEYLLDRSTELEQEGRLSKFALLETIIQANKNNSNEIMNSKKFDSIIRMIKEGPYYSNREIAVAFESS